MSTHYFWADKYKKVDRWGEDSLEVHIGMRAFAGPYCFDCGTTLCQEGDVGVHDYMCSFFKSCPYCGKEVETGCCSFTWTVMKHHKELLRLSVDKPNEKVVIDEYGNTYTAEEFLELVRECPIWFQYPGIF